MSNSIVTDFRIMVTGHRPRDLFGHNIHSDGYLPMRCIMRDLLRQSIAKYGKDSVVGISGMALGADTVWAEEVLALGVRLWAYVPCIGQEAIWPEANQVAYREILTMAEKVVMVSDKPYTDSRQLLDRNLAMVYDSEVCLAIWSGKTTGGTAHAVRTCRGKAIHHLIIYNPFTNEIKVEKKSP